VRALLVAVAAFLTNSCFSLGYLAQAATGQYRIVRAARPLEEVVSGRGTPPRLGRLLAAIPDIKAYAEAQGLRPTRSYERYADLGRPAAAWIVQGCAPLSFEMRRWSFPVVGSVPYLGFFDEREARRYAESIARGGALDVDVRTASAFSTLGWFRDPVLSTMIADGDGALGHLASLVLHESVHATLYVKDQSTFNESLATFVADQLTPPWLEGARGAGAPETRAWIEEREVERARVARLQRAYGELDALYSSGASDARKHAEKARILAAAREELRLARPLNNAALAGYKTYGAGTPAFERLLEECGGSVPRLLRAAATVGPADFAGPQQEDIGPAVVRAARACAAEGARLEHASRG